jgi:hypothetical protein
MVLGSTTSYYEFSVLSDLRLFRLNASVLEFACHLFLLMYYTPHLKIHFKSHFAIIGKSALLLIFSDNCCM